MLNPVLLIRERRFSYNMDKWKYMPNISLPSDKVKIQFLLLESPIGYTCILLMLDYLGIY